MSADPEMLNLLNSIHYSENHLLKVLLPELQLINQTQHEENLHLIMQEAQFPSDFQMNAVIPLERENLLYLPLKFNSDVRRKTLIDTRACDTAMPANFYEKLGEASPVSSQI